MPSIGHSTFGRTGVAFFRAVILLAACYAADGPQAQTRFDPVTGTGYVPAPLVQRMLGWPEAQLTARAETLGFVYKGEEQFQGICGWLMPDGRRAQEARSLQIPVEQTVQSMVRRDAANGRQVSGFLLQGYQQGAAVPWPRTGQPCTTASGIHGVWISVQTTRFADLHLRSPHGLTRISPY